jgi:hypothetical protein
MTGEGSVTGNLWRPSHKQIVQGVIGMLLAIMLVVWWLPRIAGTTWSAVFLTLSHVGLDSVMTLLVLMCLGLWGYTFTLTGSLPGLRHVQALIVNLCGSSYPAAALPEWRSPMRPSAPGVSPDGPSRLPSSSPVSGTSLPG